MRRRGLLVIQQKAAKPPLQQAISLWGIEASFCLESFSRKRELVAGGIHLTISAGYAIFLFNNALGSGQYGGGHVNKKKTEKKFCQK
jgi:hypothetical protein